MAEISNFIRTIMQNDLDSGKHTEIITRFPPEPTAYLHIGHARAIITNFELAKLFEGKTNLRFDDTNPAKEETEFVEAIINDVKWLGYEPNIITYGSDYFDEQIDFARKLINKGLAYVDDLSLDEIKEYRGTLTLAGRNSPYRMRSIEENLELFENMRLGKYQEGERVLRAKIDMAHPNMNMRDPIIYRILYIDHHRQGNKYNIYPMYDFAHPLQDATEGITHSLCSIEFENHRILYDWFVDNCETKYIPRQYEFGRLNITNTIMSKRYLRELVETKKVIGYDDPRMPTLVGLKRRGFTASSIKDFILSTGLSKVNSTVGSDMLEHSLREDLKLEVPRLMAVIDPIKVTITNYEDGKIEYLDASNNQENDKLGSRKVAFSKHLYIDRNDFVPNKPNKRYKRLSLGLEVRLFNAYFIKANDYLTDEEGNIVEVLCTYDVATKSGTGFNERKPNGTIQFVEASTAVSATFNLFEPLILDDTVDKDTYLERINPNSWIKKEGFIETRSVGYKELDRFQFLREGYFAVDKDFSKGLNFNRIVALKSSI